MVEMTVLNLGTLEASGYISSDPRNLLRLEPQVACENIFFLIN